METFNGNLIDYLETLINWTEKFTIKQGESNEKD